MKIHTAHLAEGGRPAEKDYGIIPDFLSLKPPAAVDGVVSTAGGLRASLFSPLTPLLL